RPEAAHLDRPDVAARPENPRVRRLDLERRHRDRVPHPAGAGGADEGPHDVRHRPAAADGEVGRPDPRAPRRPDRAARPPRRPDQRGRPVPRDLRPGAARPGGGLRARARAPGGGAPARRGGPAAPAGVGGGRSLGGGMAYWGGGAAGGWSGNQGHWNSQLRPNTLKRSTDGWDDEELGSVYNHQVVVRLSKFVAPYKWRLLLATIGTLGYALTTRTMPRIVAGLVNAAQHGDLGRVNELGWFFMGLAIVGAAFYYMQLTMTGWIGHRLLLGLRRDMFAHLQKLSLRFYDNNEVGRVMSRVTSDVTSLQDLMTSGFLTIIGDVAGIALSVGFLLYFDMRLALVTFSVVPVLVITMAVWQNYSRRAFIRV